MLVLFLKSILEKTESTAGCLFFFAALLIFAHGAHAGAYQHTKDGRTLVWNNNPSLDDVVSWSGPHDKNGFATGSGTLTWYRSTEQNFVTGSHLPAKGPFIVVTRYTGEMVRGKLNGPVLNVDADGKTLQMNFVNGVKARDRIAEAAPSATPRRKERTTATVVALASTPPPAPAEGPPPSIDISESPRIEIPKTQTGTAPENHLPAPKATASPSEQSPVVEVASLHSSGSSTPAPPLPPASSSNDMDSAVRSRIIADFRDETQAVLSQVGGATGSFPEVDRLDSVTKFPPQVSDSIASLAHRARDFRSQLGYETALRECPVETETVDALSAIDQVNRSIASNDIAAANSKLADFLKTNPEPISDNEKPLWRYFASIRQVTSRLEKDADIHSQRAQSLAAASKPSEAIREYQEAYRIFPNPATAEKIRQLQANSLGL
jgi:hypothetical protein